MEIEKIHTKNPTRVVINANCNATTPEHAKRDHNITPDVVFVRKDGWSLGSPYHFAQIAYRLWKDEWIYFYDVHIGDSVCQPIHRWTMFMDSKFGRQVKTKKGGPT